MHRGVTFYHFGATSSRYCTYLFFDFMYSQTPTGLRLSPCLAVAAADNICRRYTATAITEILRVFIRAISHNSTDNKWTTMLAAYRFLPLIQPRLHLNHSRISGCNRLHTDWTIAIAVSITASNTNQVCRRLLPYTHCVGFILVQVYSI